MADATVETIERRIESMDRRLNELERAGATREEIGAQLRDFSAALARLDEKVSSVPVLGQKLDELSRAIHTQDKNLGDRIEKLEKADAEFGKKLEELQAQRWKWAGGIAAVLGIAGVLITLINLKLDVSQGTAPAQPQPQGQTFQAAPQGPQVIYYVSPRPGEVPGGLPVPLPQQPATVPRP